MHVGGCLLALLVSAGLLPLRATGKVAPKPEVAILVNDWTSHIAITQLDGVKEGLKAYGTYELTPGSHTIRVSLHYTQGRIEVSGNSSQDYTFEAQPGTVIQTVCEEHTTSTLKGTWSMWFKDQSTGKMGAFHSGQAPAGQAEPDTASSRDFETTLKKAENGDLV
jgi:hypothetical protein